MTRRIILLRHAEAAATLDHGGDPARPLTPRGRRDATDAGAWLASRGERPDRVLASPAARTAETARLALAAMGGDALDVTTVNTLYLAEAEDLVEIVHGLAPAEGSTLVVGHNPGLSLLVAALVDDVPQPLRSRGLLPASVAVIDVPGEGAIVGEGALVTHHDPPGAG